ncbi:MAG: carboxypeptidase regulatory-like domain-containing protein [Candidatus Bathyarchaeota archaeon]|nr:carboxypeptidase regulatory-like domain-containing protein [Candidatus Bathyarchaeum sp.]
MVPAIFLISISVIYVLACTSSAFGTDTTYVQIQAEEPQTTVITEGYVLSKNSDYTTDDRDYTESDILYVWAWSSKIDPYNLNEHYCQIKLDDYVQEFYLNYDENMSQPNSYTGSFNLSRLEKTGAWTVQIFLKTAPPKPVTFDPNDVIQVSPKAQPTHELTISSSPISNVNFTLDGANQATPYSSFLETGSYTVAMPLNLTNDGKVYTFAEWENGVTSAIRSINLTNYTAVTAYYVLQTQNSTITGKITDNQGNPITNAKVTIVETKQYTYSLAEPAGQYKFENIPPDTYTIKVEVSGYNSSQTSVITEQSKTYTQNFSLTPNNAATQQSAIELWQLGAGALVIIGAIALILLWRSRRGFLKEIKETDYRNSLEILRLKSSLKELDKLLQKGVISKEKYETMKQETENELAKNRRAKTSGSNPAT